MISLDNTYNEEDLIDFNERVVKNIGVNTPAFGHPLDNGGLIGDIEYILEFKFD
jgi:NAD-dependent DNA ligase